MILALSLVLIASALLTTAALGGFDALVLLVTGIDRRRTARELIVLAGRLILQIVLVAAATEVLLVLRTAEILLVLAVLILLGAGLLALLRSLRAIVHWFLL